uniref:Uncharacterized protein n=1 Tax=Strombidium inclinatum TaxID=197538 RepID=A0A7S3MX83_9SPIT|mmetsp:Transcript_1719/g.2223  ORF Transcript_1719/g.2223 Transcript_1719/m.2223 type:complete len:422 (+) Transcript_1719:2125-3390(+)
MLRLLPRRSFNGALRRQRLALVHGRVVHLAGFAQVADCVTNVANRQEATSSLINSEGAGLNAVGVGEGLRRIFVGTSGHQEVASVGMHHRILRLKENQLLEIQEGLRSISNKVGALASEQIGVKLLVVELDYLREVGDRFLEHREAGVAPTLVQEVGGVGLFFSTRHSFDVDNSINIAEGFIEIVEVEPDVTSRKEQVPVLRGYGQALVDYLEGFPEGILLGRIISIRCGEQLVVAAHLHILLVTPLFPAVFAFLLLDEPLTPLLLAVAPRLQLLGRGDFDLGVGHDLPVLVESGLLLLLLKVPEVSRGEVPSSKVGGLFKLTKLVEVFEHFLLKHLLLAGDVLLDLQADLHLDGIDGPVPDNILILWEFQLDSLHPHQLLVVFHEIPRLRLRNLWLNSQHLGELSVEVRDLVEVFFLQGS